MYTYIYTYIHIHIHIHIHTYISTGGGIRNPTSTTPFLDARRADRASVRRLGGGFIDHGRGLHMITYRTTGAMQGRTYVHLYLCTCVSTYVCIRAVGTFLLRLQ